MRAQLTALKQAFRAPSLYLTWALTTVLVAYSGPFGTYDRFSIGFRLIFWAMVVAIAIAAGTAIRVFVEGQDRRRGFWQAVLIAASVSAIFLALPLALLGHSIAESASAHVPPLHELAGMIFVIAVSIGASRRLLAPPPPVTVPVERKVMQPVPRLLERLTPDKRGAMIRLSVDDHYTRLVTTNGESKLLLRFSDALKEIDGTDGMQVHRSHWVARSAVNGHRLEKGRLMLQLSDSSIVPVSRSFRKEVEEKLLKADA